MTTETQTAIPDSLESTTPRPSFSNLPIEIRRNIIYNVLCPRKTCYTYRGFGQVYILRFGGEDLFQGNSISNPITIREGLPTIFAANKELQSEALRILYSDVEAYFENAGPPVESDHSALPTDWQPPRGSLLDFSRFRKIASVVILYPACPSVSSFEPVLRSAQKQGLRTAEFAWWIDTLARLLSPPHASLPLKSLRLEVQIRWAMMDTVDPVKGFEKIVHGLTRLRGIEIIDFIVKDQTRKGKESITPARLYVHAWLDYVRRTIKGEKMMPEIHVFGDNQVVVGFERCQQEGRGAVDSCAVQA